MKIYYSKMFKIIVLTFNSIKVSAQAQANNLR